MLDGNHRCGACLYLKIETLNAYVLRHGRIVNRNIDKFISTKIPTDVISSVWEEFYEIQNWLVSSGNTFALKASGFTDDKKLNDFLIRIKFLCTILKTIKSSNSILVQFSMPEPKYKYLNRQLVSMRCIEIEKTLKMTYPQLDLRISKSCYEGYIILKDFKRAFN